MCDQEQIQNSSKAYTRHCREGPCLEFIPRTPSPPSVTGVSLPVPMAPTDSGLTRLDLTQGPVAS